MARTIGEVNLAVELWTPAVKQRFETLFAVAGRKSLVSWRQTPRQVAEVLVVEGFAPVEFQEGSRVPCVVYVGGDASQQPLGRSAKGWAAHLDADFTLSDLIDILDRAAVFLMDWRAQQKASVTLTLQRALEDLKQQGLECPHRFQIKSWIALPAELNTAQNLRVLALLSSGPLDAKALLEHSGAELPQLLTLLAQPQLQAVLQSSLQTRQEPQAAQKLTKKQPATSVTRQWVSKLTGWITRGGRT